MGWLSWVFVKMHIRNCYVIELVISLTDAMMLNCASVSQLSSVQQDAGLRAKRAVGCLQRMRNDRDYSMTEKMPLEASNIA